LQQLKLFINELNNHTILTKCSASFFCFFVVFLKDNVPRKNYRSTLCKPELYFGGYFI